MLEGFQNFLTKQAVKSTLTNSPFVSSKKFNFCTRVSLFCVVFARWSGEKGSLYRQKFVGSIRSVSQQLPTLATTLFNAFGLQARAKQPKHFNTTLSQHCWAQHIARVWQPCCDVLRHVGCFWLKFEDGQIFNAIFVNVAWCSSRLARFV